MIKQRLFPLLNCHFTVRRIGRYSYSAHLFSSSPVIIVTQLLFCHLNVCIPFMELQQKLSGTLDVKLEVI